MRHDMVKPNSGVESAGRTGTAISERGVSTLRSSYTMSEVAHFAENIEAFRFCSDWVAQYLAQPHRDLGRTGNVCPFARPAITKDTVRIAVVRLPDPSRRKDQIREAVNSYRDAFLSLGGTPDVQMLQAVLILFPDVDLSEAEELIDATKEEMKASFVEQGLMLGEFHPNNQSPGLHNPAFMPLRCDIPMLAIRRMVMTDYVFLNRSDYHPATRLQYLETYLKVSGAPDSTARKEMERTVASLRAQLHQD